MCWLKVKSSDARKKEMLRALKAASGGDKITEVKWKPHRVKGMCFKHVGEKKYERIGLVETDFECRMTTDGRLVDGSSK